MNDWYLEDFHFEHHKDLLRQAERAELVRQALAGRETGQSLVCRMLSWLGRRLVAWGQWLQKRFAADRPLRSSPVVDRAS